MATLVLTAVGGAVGGPVGAMLGGLAGRAADGVLLGGGRRRQGPRLTELAVQTSSYGTQVPRVWGRMRVGGTVFWATDLKEVRSVNRGAKGQPSSDSYSYSCSFAVLLAARPVLRVERIWADGRLLRGAAGDMKVQGMFRLHRGTEDQPADPLIASAEGIGRTPAARGHAYAVFEDLQLAEFGNRVPQMTFELVADEEAVSVDRVIGDLAGADAKLDLKLDGFAATGGSVRGAVEALANAAGGEAAVRAGGLVLRDATALMKEVAVSLTDHGTADERADDQPVLRSLAPADTVPRSVTVLHHDPARDYQAGLQRVSRPGPGWRDERLEVAAALSPSAAKAVAASVLARAEAGRVRRVARMGAEGLAIVPGMAVRLTGDPGVWRVVAATTERMATTLDLVPVTPGTISVSASGGRALTLPDRAVGRTVLHLFELPPAGNGEAPLIAPRLYAAAAGGPGWKGAGLLLSLDGGATWQDAGAIGRAAVMGTLAEPIRSAAAALFDEKGALVVTLGTDAMLLDADDAALDRGANLALVGDELLQFGRAQPLGDGRWRLERLMRGRRGTAPAVSDTGTRFVLVETDRMHVLDLPPGAIGHRVRAIASGPGDLQGPADAELVVGGASILPPPPVHLRWQAGENGGGNLRWTRRSRAGAAWLDGADVPLVEERERYAVTLQRGNVTLREVEIGEPQLAILPAERVGGRLRALVRQLGTMGPSRQAALDF